MPLPVDEEAWRAIQDRRIQDLLSLLQREEFKARIEALGGYETPLTGQVMTPGVGLGG